MPIIGNFCFPPPRGNISVVLRSLHILKKLKTKVMSTSPGSIANGHPGGGKKRLFAFDFDHTILQENSDVEILQVIPDPVPPEVRSAYDGSNWTEYMNKVFAWLHSKGAGHTRLVDFIIKEMEGTPGMTSLLEHLHGDPEADLLVLSDSNDVFIKAYLSSIGVSADVITNFAKVLDDGRLELHPYEDQARCPICPKNLCKGGALLQYLNKRNGLYSSLVYIGDGRNDLCPAMKLNEGDYIFARSGYSLEKILKNGSVKTAKSEVLSLDGVIKAKIGYWTSGECIRKELGIAASSVTTVTITETE